MSRMVNAASPLTIPTYDGSGQAMHPSIVDFGAPWNGHRYWMAMTPYPGSNSTYENPSIVVSSNGIDWSVPAGLTNPIVGPPPADGSYYSDPDLVFDGTTLYCFFRFNDASTPPAVIRYQVVTSTDGVTWSSPSVYLTSGTGYLSPAVLLDGSTWHLWQRGGGFGAIRWSSATPTGFAAGANCYFTNVPAGHGVWHFDVFKHDGLFKMLANTDYDTNKGALYLATSTDGLNFVFEDEPLLDISAGWDNSRIYRASGYIDDTGLLRVWYSALGSSGWGTGYTSLAGRSNATGIEPTALVGTGAGSLTRAI